MVAIPMLNRRMKILDPDKLLLRNYKLSKAERIEMIARGTLLTQFAIPIGSAIYFLFTQVKYMTQYGSTSVTWWYLKDTWDRLPIHLQNLFHAHWFGYTQVEPAWWVTARHDFRHVLIGMLAVLLVGAFGVGLKKRKRASKQYMLASVPLSLLFASLVAGLLIALFAWHPVSSTLNRVGVSSGIPYLGDLIGKGTLQLSIIGICAGFAAKKVLAPTFDTLQLMSIERNIAQGDTLAGWKRFVYPANYRNRFRFIQEEVREGRYECQLGSRWIGLTISLAAPLVAFWLGFGIWLNYFGPAAHAS